MGSGYRGTGWLLMTLAGFGCEGPVAGLEPSVPAEAPGPAWRAPVVDGESVEALWDDGGCTEVAVRLLFEADRDRVWPEVAVRTRCAGLGIAVGERSRPATGLGLRDAAGRVYIGGCHLWPEDFAVVTTPRPAFEPMPEGAWVWLEDTNSGYPFTRYELFHAGPWGPPFMRETGWRPLDLEGPLTWIMFAPRVRAEEPGAPLSHNGVLCAGLDLAAEANTSFVEGFGPADQAYWPIELGPVSPRVQSALRACRDDADCQGPWEPRP